MLFWSRKARDPVCGMEVDQKKAAAVGSYRGDTYYFCTPACQATFARKPKRYVEKERPAVASSGGACH